MSTVYTVMGYGGLVLAIACLVFAIVLFINWNIPKILGDITGHSQRKAIERIQREGYEASASKQEAIRNVNETGKITIRKTDTEEIRMSQRESAVATEDTTTVLNQTAEEEDTTTVLSRTAEEEDTTTVLNQENVTTVLNDDVIQLPPEKITEEGTVQQVLELIVTHTDKVVS